MCAEDAECSLSIARQPALSEINSVSAHNEIKSVNRGLSNRTWPEPAFLVLTKRRAGFGDEIGSEHRCYSWYSNVALLNSRVICLLPVGIFNHLCLLTAFVSGLFIMALKNPIGALVILL